MKKNSLSAKKDLLKNLIIAAVVVGVLVIPGLMIYLTQGISGGKVVSSDKVGEKVVKYVNENLLQVGVQSSLLNIEKEKYFYKLKLKVQDQEFDVYATKDGKFLFVQPPLDLDEKPATNQETTGDQGTEGVILEGEPSLGNPDAPLTIIEFTDFECSFCAKFHRDIFPQIKKEYIDTGKVKIILKNFPLSSIHENAQKAAEAGECAFEQGKFWEYKDILFNNQENLKIGDLKKYAQNLGLDVGKFNDCLDSGKYKDEVETDLKEGEGSGVTGTPTFLIEDKIMVGAQPFTEFQKIIEEKLK